MPNIILDGVFIFASLFISVVIVALYLSRLATEAVLPIHNSFGDWIFQATLTPFNAVKNLYGIESSPVNKDAIAAIIFSLIVFVSGNFLYFRGDFWTIKTVYFYLVFFLIFFLLRYAYVIYKLVQNKAIIEKFQPLYEVRKAQKNEAKALKKSFAHLEKREALIRKIHSRWENVHDKFSEKEEKWQEKITEEKEWLDDIWQTFVHNLDTIHQLEPNTIIAIDSNVLMKSDQYIIDAISQFPILISKHVQQEWDKNKSSESGQKAFRARQAIRRLVTLPHYTFTVSKWNNDFLIEHNLLQGVPDDEIIADYLFEHKQGKNIVVLSDDLNFIASAKVHMPVLQLKQLDMFAD